MKPVCLESVHGSVELRASVPDVSTDGCIRRSNLVEEWIAAAHNRLTAIYAPLGFGKTTLLQQIRQAWLDSDGVCFHLQGDLARKGDDLAGLLNRAVEQQLVERPDDDLTVPRREPDARRIIETIATLLNADGRQALILLDDFDRLDTAANNETLRLCVKALPPRTRFVLVSRNRIPGLSSEIACSLLELGPNELRLSRTDIAALLNEPADSSRAAQVFEWTGGWPLAVRLASPYMSLTRADGATLGRLVGHNRSDAAGILAEEVLKSLPRQHRDLLQRSAFLDRFHPDLLTECLGIEHAWQLCEQLERDYFLISRQEETDWYEAHPIVQRAAYRRLRATPDLDLKALQAGTAQWLGNAGDLNAAITLAVMAEALDDAVQMLLDAGGVFLARRKGFHCLNSALSLLPRHHRQRNDRVVLAEAIVMIREGRLPLAIDLVEGVKARLRRAQDLESDLHLLRDIAYVDFTISSMTGTAIDNDAIEELQVALESCDADDFWLKGPVHHQFAVRHLRSGNFRDAEVHLEMARHYYEAGNAPHAIVHADVATGVIKLEMGLVDDAIRIYERALDQFTAGNAICPRGAAVAHICLAEAHAERDQFDRAVEHFEQGAQVLENCETLYEYKVAAALAQSMIVTRLEGPGRAIHALRRDEEAASQYGLADFARFVSLRRLQLELLTEEAPGRISRHAFLNAQLQTDDLAHTQRERDMVDVTRGIIALADGSAAEALAALQSRIASCAARGGLRAERQMQLVACLLAEAAGRRQHALDSLQRAVAIGTETGLRRAFDDLGAEGPLLLREIIASRLGALSEKELDFVGSLVARDPAMIEGRKCLTERELEVFRRVGAGCSNKVIARDLDVSPDTVRYHLKNVYDKLGTNDRKVIRRLAQTSL